jgi:RNA recognition motif-containing protein
MENDTPIDTAQLNSGGPVQPQQSRKGNATVFISGIPRGVTDRVIFDIFSTCGTINRLDGPKPGKFAEKGNIAFVHYSNFGEAASAIENLHGHPIDGGTLSVRHSTTPAKNPK